MRVAERRRAKRAQREAVAPAAHPTAAPMTDEDALKAARAAGKDRIARSGATRGLLRALTAAMKLDLLLFGHVESGPFFALLERVHGADAGHREDSNRGARGRQRRTE